MKRILLLILLLLLLPAAARAELPAPEQLAPLDQLATESGFSLDAWSMAQGLLSGDPLEWSDLLDLAKEYLFGALRHGSVLLASLLMPLVLLSVVRQLLADGDKKAVAAGFVCHLAAALALMQAFHDSAIQATWLIRSVGRWIDALFPVLTALLVACSAPVSAAAYAPLITLGAGALTSVINQVAMGLCSAAAVIAICGSLSERFSLGKLLDLMRDALNWIIGLTLTGFLGLVTLQNLLSSGQDSATMRAAKYAVGNLIPGVGGEVADTMNAVSGSAILIKNATGVTGLVALVALCLRPLISLLAALLILKLAGALAEPMGIGPMQKLIDRFADVFSMLLVAASSAAVIGVILVGVVLATGNAAITS